MCYHNANGLTMVIYVAKLVEFKGSTLVAAIKLRSSSCLLVPVLDLGRIHLSMTVDI